MKRLLSVVILSVMLLSLVACGMSEDDLTPNGKEALNCVKKLVSMVKAPDTFLLRDDVLVISFESNDQNHTAVFIEYSAENSYGTPIRDVAAFCDYSYLGSADDIGGNLPNKEDFENMADYGVALKQSRIEIDAAMEYHAYKLSEVIGLDGPPQDDFHEKVNKNDIAAILNIDVKE